jgi:multiple sugar transport system permease protein
VAGARSRVRARHLVFYPLATILGLAFLFPFIWSVLSSVKTPQDMYAYPPVVIPSVLKWDNYVDIFKMVPFARWYQNTIFVVGMATIGTVLTSTMVAYGFARFDFRFKNIIFMFTIATLMLPSYVTLIPRYILFFQLGMVNTFYPLWLPYWFGGGAFAIFLLRQFILTLPRELDEAAVIDGANYFRILWAILVPLCKPAIATLTILTLLSHWESFLDPVIFLQSTEQYTIAVGLNYFKAVPDVSGRPTDQLLMAAALTSVLPPVALFFSFQRYFVQGIVLSGLKE